MFLGLFLIPLVSSGSIYVKNPDCDNHGGGDKYDECTLKVTESIAGVTGDVVDIKLTDTYYPKYVYSGHFGNSANHIYVNYELYQRNNWGSSKTTRINYDFNNTDYGTVDEPKDIYINMRSFFTFKFLYYSCDGGRCDFEFRPSSHPINIGGEICVESCNDRRKNEL